MAYRTSATSIQAICVFSSSSPDAVCLNRSRLLRQKTEQHLNEGQDERRNERGRESVDGKSRRQLAGEPEHDGVDDKDEESEGENGQRESRDLEKKPQRSVDDADDDNGEHR